MRVPPTLRGSASDDGLVVLNVETGQIYTSNMVGGEIWRLLEEGMSEAEIAAHLARIYGQPESVVAEDVHDFIDGLLGLDTRRDL